MTTPHCGQFAHTIKPGGLIVHDDGAPCASAMQERDAKRQEDALAEPYLKGKAGTTILFLQEYDTDAGERYRLFLVTPTGRKVRIGGVLEYAEAREVALALASGEA